MTDTRITYRDAGVDIDAANDAMQRIKQHVRSTFTPGVLTDIGSFSGMFSLAACRNTSILFSCRALMAWARN